MRFRVISALLLVTLSTGVAGCLSGSNPNLVIRNGSPEPTELDVTVWEEFPDESETPVFNETVRIAGNSERSIKIFTGRRAQYRVHIQQGNRSVTFETRPICDTAETIVELRRTGTIEYHVAFCEGLDQTGTSTPASTSASTG